MSPEGGPGEAPNSGSETRDPFDRGPDLSDLETQETTDDVDYDAIQNALTNRSPESKRRSRLERARSDLERYRPTHVRVERDNPFHQSERDRKGEVLRAETMEDKLILGVGPLRTIDHARAQNDEHTTGIIEHEIHKIRVQIATGAGHQAKKDGSVPGSLSSIITPPDVSLTEDLDKFAESIATQIHSLSDDQIEQFTRRHVETVTQRMNERQSELEAAQAGFIDRLETAHSQAEFPLDRTEVEKRLSGSQTAFMDPLLWEGDWGAYDYQQKLILANIETPPDKLDHVLTHEYLHAISGITAQIDTKAENNQADLRPDDPSHTQVLRAGLRVGPAADRRTMRFSWLDETQIEQTTGKLTNYQGKPGYAKVLPLLERLQSRVDPRYFLEAQFQDYVPGNGTPAWGELVRQVSEKYEPGLLLKLDRMIFYDIYHDSEDADSYDMPKRFAEAIAYMDEHYPQAA